MRAWDANSCRDTGRLDGEDGLLAARARKAAHRAFADIKSGRNVEAYGIFIVGISLAALGIVEQASVRLMLTGVLLAVSFLVFNSTKNLQTTSSRPKLEGREAFDAIPALLATAQEIWVYGPTAANILGSAADIRRHILEQGGRARFLVQDPVAPGAVAVEFQLDANINFRHALDVSIETLSRLQHLHPVKFDSRLLPVNPGFSLLFVNPRAHAGYVIVEIHGYRDDNISDRMHVKIQRIDSPRWYDYWAARFETMWDSARPNT